MADWVTSAACFVAKEVHQCSLSPSSLQQPSRHAEGKCQRPGSIRHFWILTPHCTMRHRIIICTVHNFMVDVLVPVLVTWMTFLLFGKSSHHGKYCELRVNLRDYYECNAASRHKCFRSHCHSWEETVIAPVLKQTWRWYYEMSCLSPQGQPLRVRRCHRKDRSKHTSLQKNIHQQLFLSIYSSIWTDTKLLCLSWWTST